LDDGAEGVGGLHAMAPLDAATAVATQPDVKVDLPVAVAARDLDLELLGDARFVVGAAVGANTGPGRLMDLADLFGAGRRAWESRYWPLIDISSGKPD
jgi:hypothetical protein